MTDPCPVTILTGFLGAGKTTLLQRLLADPQGVRFGVLVNDFGAINIDADLVAEAGTDQVALSNGCVCCSISEDMLAAVRSLLDAPHPPDRLVIEASGVSRPLAIVEALEAEPRLHIDGVFCLIDAAGFERLDFADTELAMDQAFGSDLAFLNKADLVDAAVLERIDTTLREAMPRLRTAVTRHGQVPRALLFGPEPTRGRAQPHAHHDHHDYDHHDYDHHDYDHHDHDHHDHDHTGEFESCALTSAGEIDEAAFRTILGALPEGLLRAKGILNLGGRRVIFQLVGKRRTMTVEDGPLPAENRLVAIARAGRLDPAALQSAIGAVRATDQINH